MTADLFARIEPPAAAVPTWTPLHPPRSCKTVTKYRHRDGWLVMHCGHPTALWPYEVRDPAGRLLVMNSGYAFQNLAMAKRAVELRAAGRTDDGPETGRWWDEMPNKLPFRAKGRSR